VSQGNPQDPREQGAGCCMEVPGSDRQGKKASRNAVWEGRVKKPFRDEERLEKDVHNLFYDYEKQKQAYVSPW